MRWFVRALSVVLAVGLAFAMATVSALASSRPVLSRLSTHRGPYWGETQVTVHGHNFSDVRKVLFGGKAGHGVHVVSPTTLTVIDPGHRYGTVDVRVVTRAGTSSRTRHDRFTFAAPTLDTPIQGGLTARQEQRISAHVRATHRGVHVAHRAARWTAAMGATAMKRARSWLGLPYSWAGGNASGPTTGVCAHNGGDLDCHVVGFDCSGLALYAWAPYRTMVHFAATQYRTAGSFHPTIGELMPGDLVFFAGYVPHGIGHVAIYAGHGMVIQSPQSGSRVMRSRLADVIAGDGPYRGATRPTSTGKQGIGPGLSSITSRISVHGGNVTITGRRLDSVTSVSVGSTTLYSFVKRTARTLVVRLPARHSGSARVVVANAWATAQRTVHYVAAPHVSRLSTSHGSTAGGNSVTLHGTSLIGLTKVTVGSRSVAFHSLSSRRVTVRMPAHGAGSVRVRVYGRFGASKAKTYVFRAPPAPSPTSPAPTSPAPTSPAPTSPAPTSPAPTSPAPASTPPTSPSPPSPRSTPPSLGP